VWQTFDKQPGHIDGRSVRLIALWQRYLLAHKLSPMKMPPVNQRVVPVLEDASRRRLPLAIDAKREALTMELWSASLQA
jgi:hypothetical protein